MADRYLNSAASGSANGLTKTDAYTTFEAARAGIAAGDRILVHYQHSETLGATTTYAMPGTNDAPNEVISIDFADDSYRQRALVRAGVAFSITLNGNATFYGVDFTPGNSKTDTSNASLNLASAVNSDITLVDAIVTLPNHNSARVAFGGGSGSKASVENIQIDNGNANGIMGAGVSTDAVIRNSKPWGLGVAPTALQHASLNGSGNMLVDGCDLTDLGSGKTLVIGGASVTTNLRITSSQLSSAVTPYGAVGNSSSTLEIVNCMDSSGAMRNERWDAKGSHAQNVANYRSGGADDGVAPHSWRFSTTTRARSAVPFKSLEIDFVVPDDKVGVSTTLTVHLLTDNVTLTNEDVFAELQALVTTGSKRATKITSRPVRGVTPANLPTDSATWTTSGITTPVKQYIELTFTPRHIGSHRLRIFGTKASTVFFACPAPEIV